MRAAVRVARGDVPAALADDERALEQTRELEDPEWFHIALCRSARIRMTVGNDAGVLADEMLALAWADVRGAMILWPELAFTLVALGRGEELVELADRDERPSRWRDPARTFAAGDPLRAAELFSEIGSLPNEAYSRLRAAEQLAREGRRAEAEAQLEQALEFYRSVGATRYIREGEALLAAAS